MLAFRESLFMNAIKKLKQDDVDDDEEEECWEGLAMRGDEGTVSLQLNMIKYDKLVSNFYRVYSS